METDDDDDGFAVHKPEAKAEPALDHDEEEVIPPKQKKNKKWIVSVCVCVCV